jgi:hypothetical protein
MAALMLPADAVAEVGYEFVHDSLRRAGCCAELFKSGRAEKIGSHTIEDHGSPESFLLYGVCLSHPTEGSAQDRADALKVVFRGRERLEEIDRVAAVGVTNIVCGKKVCRFHPRHRDGKKQPLFSNFG